MSKQIDSQQYELIDQVTTDGDIPISLYRNKITGLTVVCANVECPIVSGDLVFATEAFDDDGLPHTLEHLVFMGSENYPYKGILDLLASKCLASGTNALTETDNTSYNMRTAGCDGFLQLLPIYLDHVLFPTLTDEAYVTEVHHINADGEDAGVVYCEMQARENTGDSRCYLEMLRSLYPGKCGYSSETGGILNNLRTSTNKEKVRSYHREFYHSRNLCIVVTGPVEPKALFESIKCIEDKIVEKNLHLASWNRPWQTPVAPLEASVNRKIQYSSDSDEDGLVYIGYRGPNVLKDYKELVAISIIQDYLNSTAISPIQRDFVESDEPYCSSVSHYIIENSTSCFYFSFESVGKEYLDKVETKLVELLENIVKEKEKLDMSYMETIISRKRVNILSTAETSPHSMVFGPAVGNFLYGVDNLKDRCQEIPILEDLIKCDSKYWTNLINKYMVGDEARKVCVVGEPSPEFMEAQSLDEKTRIAKQKEHLKDELPAIAEKIKACVEKSNTPPPKELLNSVEIPSAENIKFHPIERVVLDEAKTLFRIQYDSIKTNFVTLRLLLNNSLQLTKPERLYLPLLSEVILESPIVRGQTMIPHEKVIAELFADTISYGAGVGVSSGSAFSTGVFSMLFTVAMQVEMSKYEKAVQWFHELLFKTVFTQERIKTIATRMVSDISQYKRSGGKVVSAAMSGITYQSNSNQWAVNFMRQQKFLKLILKQLKTNPESVVQNMNKIRDSLCQSENILIHLSLNKDLINVNTIHEPWMKLIPHSESQKQEPKHIQLDQIIPCHRLAELIDKPKAVIIGIGSVESNYMQQIVKSINSPTHPDLAAVEVLIQYLTQLEGPLWRHIRGLGLTYSYAIQLSPADGLMYFALSRSTGVLAAYRKTIEIVNRFISGEDEFEDSMLEAAKSSLIFELIRREKSAAGKSLQSLFAYLRGLDIDFNKDLIRKVAKVSKEDLRRVAPMYLTPLFEDPERRTALCCHPCKVEALTKGFEAAGCELTQISLEEAFLNNLE